MSVRMLGNFIGTACLYGLCVWSRHTDESHGNRTDWWSAIFYCNPGFGNSVRSINYIELRLCSSVFLLPTAHVNWFASTRPVFSGNKVFRISKRPWLREFSIRLNRRTSLLKNSFVQYSKKDTSYHSTCLRYIILPI